jgi:multidrug resistance protein
MLMDVVGMSIIFPVVPFIVQRYSHAAFMITALSGIYAAMQFIAAPALGKISDRTGRRPVLLISVLGSAVAYFIFGIGGALWILFLSRAIDGITGGNMSTAAAYIADVSTPEERPKNFALIGMAYGFGFIVGPALGGVLSRVSIDAPAFLAGILALVSVALIYFLLPESLPKEQREHTPLRASDFNPLVAVGEMLRKSGLGLILAVSCIFAFAFNGANSTLGVYVAEKFNAQPWQIGLLFVVTGLVTAITQAVFVPRVVKRFGEKTMAVVSMLGQGLGLLLVFLAPQFWMLYVIALLQSGVGGFIWSTIGTLAANRVELREQGKLAGVNAALQSLMSVFGPLFAGLAYDRITPGAPYWIGAILFGIGALLLTGVREKSGVSRAPWSM